MKAPALAFVLAVLLAAGLSAAPRSRAPVRAFLKASGFPNGRPGFVVDHVLPLCAGGADAPSNMQFQEHAASLVKDAHELALCRALRVLEHDTGLNLKVIAR
jgi:hypothetical protein